MNQVNAQNLSSAPSSCLSPNAVTCLTATVGPLAPIAGQPYQYTVDVPTPAGTKVFNWFVTTDQTFITSGSGLTASVSAIGGAHVAAVDAGLGGTYNDTDGTGIGTETINITWNSFTPDAANPVFLVIYVENTDLCTVDNLEAFIIEPQFAFTLDIANIEDDGTALAADASDCVSEIVSAQWNATDGIVVDYGENYLYFHVNAANFYDSWMPSFQLSGVNIAATASAVQAVDWAYPAGAVAGTWVGTTTSDDLNYVSATAVDVQASGASSVGTDGECIIVRVHIVHNQDETITQQDVVLAVNGTMYDGSATAGNEYANSDLDDIDYASCSAVDFDDSATHILTPRPDINESAPTPFVTKDRL
jgi:hypothetical protein